MSYKTQNEPASEMLNKFTVSATGSWCKTENCMKIVLWHFWAIFLVFLLPLQLSQAAMCMEHRYSNINFLLFPWSFQLQKQHSRAFLFKFSSFSGKHGSSA